MEPAQHTQAKELFFRAIELPDAARDRFLAEACAGDPGLRSEVDSLLRHHAPGSILEDAPAIQREAPATGGSAITRHFASPTQRRIWALAAAVGLAAVGLWTHARLEAEMLRIRGDELTTVLEAESQALGFWIDDQVGLVDVMAADPRVVRLAGELVAIGERNDTEASRIAAWTASPARAELAAIFDAFASEGNNAAGGVVVDARGLAMFSTREELTGTGHTALALSYVARAFAGHSFFVRPYRIEDLNGIPESGTMYSVVMAPIRDASGAVIAVIITGQRAYGPHSMSEIFQVARLGSTGETYAFDTDGLMLTDTRSAERLREAGLAQRAAGGPDWDRTAQLNVTVRDPGGDLAAGHAPALPQAERPLTRLAAAAVASRSTGDGAGRQGLVLEPYRNYRGVEVMGAWRWLPEHDIGLATEIEAAEALAPLRYLDLIFGLLFLLLTAFTATTLLSLFSMARLRRRIGELRELGPYRLLSHLGQGGMGTVYLAEHGLLQRQTAIKVLSGRTTPDSDARFEKEVRSASRLTHHNTIEIYDFGRTPEGVFYYAMEYVEGPTLAAVVSQEGPLPAARVVHLLRQACGSLGEAHQAGLVHRDVKPQNLMLCVRGGQHDTLKVLDFGLVMEVTGAAERAAERIAGTPAYMAPERITSPGDVDARVDVYALGAVAFYLLAGRPVFQAENSSRLLETIVAEAAPAVSSVAAQRVPAALDELIRGCLAKDPGDRPQTVFAVLDRLREIPDEWNQGDAAKWWARYQTERTGIVTVA